MEPPRPTRWRRRDARQRSSVRRLLAWGGAAGLIGGLIAQRAVDGTNGQPPEYEWLIRGALVLPAVIFFLWWLLFPGIALEEPAEEELAPIDADERLERIEATFDAAAVPRARRTTVDQVNDEARGAYRASIRRDAGAAPVDPAIYGIRRPARRVDSTDAAS